MVVRSGMNSQIEGYKRKLGLRGDVYVVEGHFIESLESHRRLIPDSTAVTIEEAEVERLKHIEAEREMLARLAAESAERGEIEEGERSVGE